MNINHKHDIKNKLYKQHVKELTGVSFTPREIDVISCILHNRGEKKIASLLSISYRTVGTHVHNIMNKLGFSSREYIIDFVEQSGKLPHIKQYYYLLIVQNTFEKNLQKIAKVINRDKIICSADFSGINDENKDLLHNITQCLSFVNIDLVDNYLAAKTHLYVVNNSLATKKQNNIALLLDPTIETSSIKQAEYIDFTKNDNYCLSILLLIQKIIDKPELNNIIQEFKTLKTSLDVDNTTLTERESKRNEVVKKHRIKKVALIFIIFVSLALIGFAYLKTNMPKNYVQHKQQTIAQINNQIIELVKIYSADNIFKTKFLTNIKLKSEVKQIINQALEKKELYDYLQSNTVTYDELINFVYVLNSLAGQYLYTDFDWQESRKVLLFAKELVENYVVLQSKVKFSFAELDREEKLNELNSYMYFAEIYTKTIYFLGRTYIYQGALTPDERNQAIQYLELSKYLGKKLHLFEAILSDRNGIASIKIREVKDKINKGNNQLNQQKLRELITLYKNIKDDDNSYKIEYKPGNAEIEKKTVPKQDYYNKINCVERLIECYSILLSITAQQRKEDIKELAEYILGTEENPGLILDIGQNRLPTKKIASVYNTIGNSLLRLISNEQNKEFTNLTTQLKIKFATPEISDLELIYKIFNQAIKNSKSADFTKADAYTGLVKTLEKQLTSATLTVVEKAAKQSAMEKFKLEASRINQTLRRK